MLTISPISFPGLGINIDPASGFPLGPLTVNFYGICIATGLLLAVLYGCIRAKQFGFRQDDVLDLLFAAVPLSLVGCRAYYVLFNLKEFRGADGGLDWGKVVRISDGGIAIYGAVIAGAIALNAP